MPMSAALARRLEVFAMRGITEQARERKSDLQGYVDDMVRALRGLREICDGDQRVLDFIEETARGLIDQASNIEAACNRDLDNGGELSTSTPLDLSEVEQVLA